MHKERRKARWEEQAKEALKEETFYWQTSEQAGKRPVVVVSNDWVNRHNHVYTVVPLTTQINRLDLPTNVLIPANSEEGVTRDAVALCAQTRSLDAVRILRKKGRLNKDTLERITKGVLVQIGIEPMILLS